MLLTRDNLTLTDEQDRFDVSAVCALILTASWASCRSVEQISESLRNSTCLALMCEGRTIGFVRAITDHSVNSYICDFVIVEECRGQKLGTWMLEVLMAHPDLARTNQLLITESAQAFYEPHGFRQHPFTCMKRPVSAGA
ncbi:MAG: GNAT family N-acetyltransferase [Prosthecobacter sp.]|nr:GNAT family N-acetyltransferase [Prosthecobacter sp.]